MSGHHLELVKIKTLRVIMVNCRLSKLKLHLRKSDKFNQKLTPLTSTRMTKYIQIEFP